MRKLRLLSRRLEEVKFGLTPKGQTMMGDGQCRTTPMPDTVVNRLVVSSARAICGTWRSN